VRGKKNVEILKVFKNPSSNWKNEFQNLNGKPK
jgi:hypothetical protein